MNSLFRVSIAAVGGFCFVQASAGAAAAPTADGLWRGNAGAAMSATSGNTNSRSILLKVDMSRASASDKVSLGGNVNYAHNEVDGVGQTTSNKIGAFGQYDFNLTQRLFAFGKLALDRDELTDLALRSSVAAGLGYKLVDTSALRWSVFGGVGYTADRYRIEKTIRDDTGLRFERGNLLLAEESVHEISPTVNFKQRLEVLPGVSGDKATLLKFTADVGVAINSTLSLTVGLIDTYDNRPPNGQKQNDLSLFTGINLKLGPT